MPHPPPSEDRSAAPFDHLSPGAMRALDRGEASAVLYFREHLASACEVCEQFLLSADGALNLEGATDLLLLGEGRTEDAEGFARVRAKLRGNTRGRRLRVLGGLAAAAAVALIAAPLALRTPAKDDGIKGGHALELELKVAHQQADGQVQRVDPRSVVGPGGALLLRYHASEAATGRVYRQRPDEAAPTLLGEVTLESGTHELRRGEDLLGISLEGEAGLTTFILEASSPRGAAARASVTVDVSAK